jgi:putative membrane protein
MPESQPTPKSAPPDQVQLALERTYLAHERTLMAWVRTGTSLVTFGFTLYKFFQFLREQETNRNVPNAFGARIMGMLMIAIGVVTLVLACLQHRQSMKRLRAYYSEIPFSPALPLAILMSGLGLVMLLAPLFSL